MPIRVRYKTSCDGGHLNLASINCFCEQRKPFRWETSSEYRKRALEKELRIVFGCILAGQSVVSEPSDQTEEGHHQGFRQALLLHVRVFSYLQHPAPPGAGPPPVWPRPTSQRPPGASSPLDKWLLAKQPRRRLLHLPWHQQQHSSQLPTRRHVWALPPIAGRYPVVSAVGSPTPPLPLLLHAAAGGGSSRTDVRLRLRLLRLWAVHEAGQEGGRSRREENCFLSSTFSFQAPEGTMARVSVSPQHLALPHVWHASCCRHAKKACQVRKKQGLKTEVTRLLSSSTVLCTTIRNSKKDFMESDITLPCKKDYSRSFAEFLRVCVADKCFYHHSLYSSFQWLFTFCPVSCVCVIFLFLQAFG